MKLLIIALSFFLMSCFANAIQLNAVHKSAAYTVQAGDDLVIVSGSGYNVTLPSCSTTNDGEGHIFKNQGSGTIAVVPNGTDTIEGAAGGNDFFPDQANNFYCDGPNHNWVGTSYW